MIRLYQLLSCCCAQAYWAAAVSAYKLADLLHLMQWFKMYLVMLEDRNTNEQRRQQLGPHHNGEAQPAGKNFASGMSLESRQAVIQMIDHIVTPMLVDQWRCPTS